MIDNPKNIEKNSKGLIKWLKENKWCFLVSFILLFSIFSLIFTYLVTGEYTHLNSKFQIQEKNFRFKFRN